MNIISSSSKSKSGSNGAPLVLTSISQSPIQNRGFSGLLLYRNSLKVLKDSPDYTRQEKPTSLVNLAVKCECPVSTLSSMQLEQEKRGSIDSFSVKSKSRLQHLCSNSTCDFISQITLTYDGHAAPVDGSDLKADLNHFLTRLRQKFKGVKYVWVLEFQGNGNPHFHVFLNLEYSRGLAWALGFIWNTVVRGSLQHLLVHQFIPKHEYKRPLKPGEKHGSFCPWSMGDGSYLTYKYLSKSSQKSVPPHFQNVGRFWGASRGIVSPIKAILQGDFESVFQDTINTLTGEVVQGQTYFNSFFRTLRKFHENRVNSARVKDYHRKVAEYQKLKWSAPKYPKRFKSPLRRVCNAMINGGTRFYNQYFKWYEQQIEVPF